MGPQANRPSAGFRWKGSGKPWALVAAVGILAVAALLLGARAEAAAPTVPGATYIGSEQCKGCHEDLAKHMEHTLHGKLLGTKLSKGEVQQRGCEGCHGAGSKHLEDPGNPTFNLRFGKTSPLAAADKNAVCLQCHSRGKQVLWQGSQHESRDVACATCHSVHAGTEKRLLKVVKPERFDSRGQAIAEIQYDLCGQCHQVRAMQLYRSSHMPTGVRGEAGKIVCTSCHNPHGTTTEKLIVAISINELCTTCHTDKRGPFLWEHVPVLESCMNCHQPHGSNNPPMLSVRGPRLCETCHAGGRHNAQTYPMTERRAFNRSCVNCHMNIHGSNHISGERFLR